MKILAVLLSLAFSFAQAQTPQTYLVSVVDIPLNQDESISAFAFESWGIRVKAVCRLPDQWTITAGNHTNPSGVFKGEGSNGVSWPRESSPAGFQNLILIDLEGPMQDAVPFPGGNGEIPSTFGGHASIQAVEGERQEPLTIRNIRLVPADACPPLEDDQ